MPVQFSILASGSRGNAALVKAGPAGLLIDFGIGPKAADRRLASVGASFDDIHAAVLTHTHGDHVDPDILGRFLARSIPIYCHAGQVDTLRRRHERVEALEAAGLIRTYDERPFLTPDGLRVEPIELSHDGGPTYGFRFEARPERRARAVGVGYLADTGTWRPEMVELLGDVDVLGVEFNHDVDLQRRSGRSRYLIARNLGDRGHLSNDQGASLVAAVLARSAPGTLRHVVLLHLSEQCNRPELAIKAARAAVRDAGRRVSVHAAEQAIASPNLMVTPRRGRRPRVAAAVADLPF